MQKMGKWYATWQPRHPPETGTYNFLLDEEVKAYSLVVEDLDVEKLQESKMKEVAEQINQLCEELGIPGRVYLVPGSLWIIFCLKDELSRDCRRKFAASLKSWIHQQKQSGANGWTLAQDPCWKPLHAVSQTGFLIWCGRLNLYVARACLQSLCGWGPLTFETLLQERGSLRNGELLYLRDLWKGEVILGFKVLALLNVVCWSTLKMRDWTIGCKRSPI